MEPNINILIVDDDESLAEALMGLFESVGYDVSWTTNSDETMNIISRESIALVLLDLYLGKECGLEILPRVKEERPDVSIFVMTAKGTVEHSVKALHLGADSFLTKPINPQQLLALVEKGLEVCTLRRKVIRYETELPP